MSAASPDLSTGCHKARTRTERTRYFWDKARGSLVNFPVADWETLYEAIAFGYRGELVAHDTS